MNVGYDVIIALLSAGVGIQILCSIGVLIMPGPYAKLHYQGPASSLAAVLIAVAVIVQDGYVQSSVKAVFLAIILMISSPIISHATARAAKIREETGLDEDSNGGV